jgi:putative oxidoreductase
MTITIVELLVPSGPSPLAQASLLGLRVFLGICFIRHGWPKLRNLDTWATAMKTPKWLCFLSAFSMWGAGIALIPGLLTPLAALAILVSMAYACVVEILAGFPFIAPDPYQIPKGDYVGPMGIGEYRKSRPSDGRLGRPEIFEESSCCECAAGRHSVISPA